MFLRPTARPTKNALAATSSAMPAVKSSSARPRRLALDSRVPTQATTVRASTT
jgi:hypothetical protein